MSEETTNIVTPLPPEKPEKPNASGSRSEAFGISVRGWLAIMLTITICSMSLMQIVVTEPMYSIATFAIGFYFGQKTVK